MIGLGSIVNAAAIVAGGCVGLVAGKVISERVRTTLVSGMAVGTLFVGASSTFSKMLSVGDGGAVECRGALMLVMSLAIGAVAGEIIDIDGKLERVGVWLRRVSHNENDGSFLNGFVTASLTYCIGAMAILGALEDGLRGDPSLLYLKSAMDGMPGRWLGEDEMRRHGIWRDDHKFGDAIFLAEAGVQFCPSDMGVKPLNGMHGFAPDDEDSLACWLSTEPVPDGVTRVCDYFRVMTAD